MASSLLTLDPNENEAALNASQADIVPDCREVPLKFMVSDTVPSMGIPDLRALERLYLTDSFPLIEVPVESILP